MIHFDVLALTSRGFPTVPTGMTRMPNPPSSPVSGMRVGLCLGRSLTIALRGRSRRRVVSRPSVDIMIVHVFVSSQEVLVSFAGHRGQFFLGFQVLAYPPRLTPIS
jgi:hypothetical protein